MKSLLTTLILMAVASAPSLAQVKQTDCEREVDVRLNEMWSVSAAAGSVTYKKIMDRAMMCIQGGQCSKPQALVRLQELMVDEEVIDIQRKKVTLMKEFASRSGPAAKACEVARLLPSLIEELTALNAQQLSRFESMSFAPSRAQSTK